MTSECKNSTITICHCPGHPRRFGSGSWATAGRRPPPRSTRRGAPSGRTAAQRGFLVSIAYGDRTFGYVYNPAGNLALATDPLGRMVSFEYDKADRPTKMTLPGGRVTQVSYDPNGNITSITPPGRAAHGFSYSRSIFSRPTQRPMPVTVLRSRCSDTTRSRSHFDRATQRHDDHPRLRRCRTSIRCALPPRTNARSDTTRRPDNAARSRPRPER